MKPFQPIKKPVPGEWYYVTLEVTVEIERPGYDAEKNAMATKTVRETRIVHWRSMVAGARQPGEVAIEGFTAGGERYFLSRGLAAKLTDEPPKVLGIERWSDYEDRQERERERLRAETHGRTWPSNRS